MRFGLLILTVFIDTLAQKGLEYQYDENGHILFMEVVETRLVHEKLLTNASALMEAKENQTAEENGKFKKTSSFRLYKKRLGKTPHGELSYSIRLEVRENRYRYIITDFRFHPLEKNRYSRFVKTRSGPRELEPYLKEPDKTWQRHRETILTKMEQLIEDIKLQMSEESKEEEKTPPSVKIDDEW